MEIKVIHPRSTTTLVNQFDWAVTATPEYFGHRFNSFVFEGKTVTFFVANEKDATYVLGDSMWNINGVAISGKVIIDGVEFPNAQAALDYLYSLYKK